MKNEKQMLKSTENDDIIYYRKKYKKFIDTVCAKYKMHPSDLETCKLYGLWRFVRTYDKNKSSVKTYIARCLRWECLKALKPIREFCDINTHKILDKEVTYELNFYLDSLSEELQNLIELRYVKKFSTSEIAKQYNCSRQTIHRKLSKAKMILSNDYGV